MISVELKQWWKQDVRIDVHYHDEKKYVDINPTYLHYIVEVYEDIIHCISVANYDFYPDHYFTKDEFLRLVSQNRIKPINIKDHVNFISDALKFNDSFDLFKKMKNPKYQEMIKSVYEE